MFNYNPYNQNLLPYSGFNVYPVGRIEEVKTIFPDLQGKPLFFFDQSRNEFFVKQRNVETGEIQTLRYTLSSEPVKTAQEVDVRYFDEQIKQLREEIERIGSAVAVKTEKGINKASGFDSETSPHVEKRKAVSNDELE